MRRRNSAQGLILATVNVLVIVGVTFIVKSLAAGDADPSQSSLSLPAESEFALPSPGARAALTSGGSSSASLASPSAAAGQDTSAQVVPPSATGREEAPAIEGVDFDQLSYLPSRPFAPLVADSGSPQLQASASGYGSSSAPSYSRRSGSGGGFSGMGGGFPSSGGGGGGRPSNAQNSQINPASAALRSSSGGPTASAAGAPLLPSQAQGNPFLSGGNGLGGPPSFVLTLVPKLGSGAAVGSGLVLPTGAGGSTANVTQLQTPVSVPEPSTALLLGCGLALAAYRNRRRLTPRT